MRTVNGRAKGAIHIGVNAHLLSLAENYRSAGISWYCQNLLRHLPGTDPEIQYTVFLGERRYEGVRGLELRVSRLPTHSPPIRILWEQAIQPWALRRAGVDLLHGLALIGPLLSGRPLVITIHDLSFLHYPQSFHALKRLYLKLFTRLSVRRAQRVIAISDSTRQDIIEQYGVPSETVDLIYYGSNPAFRPLPAEKVAQFRSDQGLPERFILFVGTLEPRKNVVRLIEAYSRLPASNRPPLMLIGAKGWLYDSVFARVDELDLSDAVRFVGYVPGNSLPWWYNAADLFVYPSIYEGFGLPPLEAMACGTPVVTSKASSLPEVVGTAGLLVDPTSTESLASAMEQVLSDQGERDRMRSAGLAQARRFSWDDTARRTLDTYRRALLLEPQRRSQEQQGEDDP